MPSDYLTYTLRTVLSDIWSARMDSKTADDILDLEDELRVSAGSLQRIIDDIAEAKAAKKQAAE